MGPTEETICLERVLWLSRDSILAHADRADVGIFFALPKAVSAKHLFNPKGTTVNNLAKFLDLNVLNALPSPNPPHALLEKSSGYSIVMNLLGIDEKDIGIRANESKREIAVLAKKVGPYEKRGFYWIFGVPAEGFLGSISARFKGGVLEIQIPKDLLETAA